MIYLPKVRKKHFAHQKRGLFSVQKYHLGSGFMKSISPLHLPNAKRESVEEAIVFELSNS